MIKSENRKIVWGAVAVLLLMMVTVPGNGSEAKKSPQQVAASAEQIKPLQPGAKAPDLSLKTVDGTDFDLSAALKNQPTVLVFYRGGW